MTFTRALGYAKHPLSVVHAFADARFRRRTLFHTGDIANSLAVVASKNVNMGTNYYKDEIGTIGSPVFCIFTY